MSNTPSSTPNLSTTTEFQSTELPGTSRPHAHETGPLDAAGVRQRPNLSIPKLSAPSPLSDPHPSQTDIVRPQTRPASASAEEPPGKRMRRSQSADRPSRKVRTSPSASSQEGLADNEQEGEQSHGRSGFSVTVAAPPKKKRTRTLTTPHQSAVLHALLAQSRFPTTAMREEVGRSIGLSARKVQIWFQNQRQKARRPRSQSAAPLTGPPQYGPFSNAPPTALGVPGPSSAGLYEMSTYPSGALIGGSHHDYRYSGYPPGDIISPIRDHAGYRDALFEGPSYSRQVAESPSQLAGPGVPGSSASHQPESITRRRQSPVSSLSGSSQHASVEDLPAYHYQASGHETRGSLHTRSLPSLRRERRLSPRQRRLGSRERDMSRTLPPLTIGSQRQTGTLQGDFGSSVASPYASGPRHLFREPGSSIGEPPASVFSGEGRAPPSSYRPFPPPSPLEPPPRWDLGIYTPRSRPGSSWSGLPPPSSYRGPVEADLPITHHRRLTDPPRLSPAFFPVESAQDPPRESPLSRREVPPRRARRFDPVRASQEEGEEPPPSVASTRPQGDGDQGLK